MPCLVTPLALVKKGLKAGCSVVLRFRILGYTSSPSEKGTERLSQKHTGRPNKSYTSSPSEKGTESELAAYVAGTSGHRYTSSPSEKGTESELRTGKEHKDASYTSSPSEKGTESQTCRQVFVHFNRGYTSSPSEKGTERLRPISNPTLIVEVTPLALVKKGLKVLLTRFWRS